MKKPTLRGIVGCMNLKMLVRRAPTLGALLLLMLLLFGLGMIFAAPAAANTIDSRAILEPIDALVSYPNNDFSAEYTITQQRPGQGSSVTKAYMFRRDREDKYLILIQEPAVDRGKGYLKQADVLWLYDPVDRRFNSTSARDRFQNSNARNSDFTSSTLAQDYRIVAESREQLGAFSTRVYEMEAIHDGVTFPKMRLWVDEDNLVRKFEDYSLSGQLMRTTAIPSYRHLGSDHYVPVQIVIEDALAGRTIDGVFRRERTVISVEKPSLRTLPDAVFTRQYLERVSR